MKKTVAGIIALLTICLCLLAGCANKLPEKPTDTNLDFWIGEDVSNADFSEYHEVLGWFGAREFYGKGYKPIERDDNGEVFEPPYPDPPYYVKYLVSAYPDYSDGGQYVTQIKITDPKVDVYGINCESTLDEFNRAMRTHGYEVTILHESPYSCAHTAKLGGNAWINFIKKDGESTLIIGVTITNKNNIVF